MLHLRPAEQRHVASAAVAAPTVERHAALAATPAVTPAQHVTHTFEPELLATAPRRVVGTASASNVRLITTNVIVGCALLFWYVAQNGGLQSEAFAVRVAVFALSMLAPHLLVHSLIGEARCRIQKDRLRLWRPTAGTVIERTPKTYGSNPTIALRYRYEVTPGEFAVGTWLTGAANPLQPGDTFTLLQSPRRPRTVVPYGEIKMARLADAPAR